MTATATPAPPRRAALGHFLKAQPRAAEPRGCVGVTWYTWLEQGRAINVSDQVLDAVALWCCFAEPGGRDKFVNDAEEVRHLVARLRAEYETRHRLTLIRSREPLIARVG